MIIDQSRIGELVSRPSESLNVEIKRWMNPEKEDGIATLVKAAFAIRNRNGGFLILGFDDETLTPEDTGRPIDPHTTFHIDKIQSIISRYASEPFEIGVGFSARDGKEHAVIVVSGGVIAPVAVKRSLASAGKQFLSIGDVYFRTLNANGTPSTARARPEDWRDILEICFENREADIGRFLRRHLPGRDISMFGVSSSPTLSDRLAALLEDGQRRFEDELAIITMNKQDKELLEAGKWSVGLTIDPPEPGAVADQEFLNRALSGNPAYSGWPVWIDSRFIITAQTAVRGNAWQALIFYGGHFDFWRINPKGELYLIRNLPDDVTDRVPPRDYLDPVLVLRLITETLATAIAIATALGRNRKETRLGFAFRWNKLSGRRLSRWTDLSANTILGTAHDDELTTFVEMPLDTALSALAPFVEQATRRLFALFHGYRVDSQFIESVVQQVLQRR